ncbi:MAG: hypothetical protein ACOY6N_06970 [Pseudomonadota bacterium]
MKRLLLRACEKFCCAVCWLRCAVLAPSPNSMLCLGRCAPGALPSARSRRIFSQALTALALCCAWLAHAEDNVLLIQQGPQGFVVWHGEGESRLDDDTALELMASATPEGGPERPTEFGPARAYELPEGVLIRLPAAAKDRALLVDRDACGHIKLWHAEGTTQLTDAQLTDIVLSALPEGGPRLRLDGYYAKAFVGKLGVTVTLWKAPPRK